MELGNFIDILAEELHLPAAVVAASASLESLGVESIDVVQVVQRVELALGRRLDAVDISAVESVGDLYGALVGGDAATPPGRQAARTSAAATREASHAAALRRFLGDDPLAGCRTLIDVVRRRAALTPAAEAFRFADLPCSFAELAAAIDRVARALRSRGVEAGDRVVLVSPNCAEFFALYYGIQRLRAAAVPVFHRSGGERIAAIAAHCGARLIVAAEPLDEPRREALAAALPAVALVDAAALLRPAVDDGRPLPRPEADDLAMLQYTSGTTGDAKGVMLTHGALVANIRQIIPATQFTAADVVVSWLPVYHDMGLIAMTMCPLYVGARLVLLPVSLKPRAWLEAITSHRGTVTAAPDFAYRYALRFAGDAARYDLTSLRFALIAAEPIRAATVREFEATHGLVDVLRPGYGLAELCVGASMWPFDQRGLAVDERGAVGVGWPLCEVEVAIRDGARTLAAGEVGEICLRSPSQTLGYYRDPARTAAAYTRDGYLRTGDRGYVDARGILYIVGRLKDDVIVGGRNLSPREVEELAEGCEGVVAAMAVGVDLGDDAGEQLHVVVEAKRPSVHAAAIRREVGAAIRRALGLRPEGIHVVRRGGIPRTYNGKLRYAEMRARIADAARSGADADALPVD
ncbi:MAG: AMP-binding protein [Nannocystaceae bacterium]